MLMYLSVVVVVVAAANADDNDNDNDDDLLLVHSEMSRLKVAMKAEQIIFARDCKKVDSQCDRIRQFLIVLSYILSFKSGHNI